MAAAVFQAPEARRSASGGCWASRWAQRPHQLELGRPIIRELHGPLLLAERRDALIWHVYEDRFPEVTALWKSGLDSASGLRLVRELELEPPPPIAPSAMASSPLLPPASSRAEK